MTPIFIFFIKNHFFTDFNIFWLYFAQKHEMIKEKEQSQANPRQKIANNI